LILVVGVVGDTWIYPKFCILGLGSWFGVWSLGFMGLRSFSFNAWDVI